MGKFSQSKGIRGEREVIDLLQPIVDTAYQAAGLEPIKLKRTSSMQADGGGCDVHGLPWLALECKWDESYQVDAWWRQCLQQAQPGQMPALVYKKNHRPWRARLWLYIAFGGSELVADLVADVSIEDFLRYFQKCLQLCLPKGRDNANL
jgi:hypothetical protein